MVVSAPASSVVRKSIKGWALCNGTADDTDDVAAAFAAAADSAFTLVVDCPVRIHVGSDVMRSIFIDNGTSVDFTDAGKIIVDNVLIPAFVIANSSNISLTNWNVEYRGGIPVNPHTAGYHVAGEFVPNDDPGGAFNNLRLTPWLTANRGIQFDTSKAYVSALWPGPTDISAVFYISGSSANISITGMQMGVPAGVGGNHFIPVAFAMVPNFTSNQTVTSQTIYTTKTTALPQNLTFSNVRLDGTYMGWVGMTQNAQFQTIRSVRYGDLQDSQGGTIGGVNKWFAPPHLFYLLPSSADDGPALVTKNVQIKDVVDLGVRVGKARDLGGDDAGSGNALSLKLGCVDCSVDTYNSYRPDGFLDVLASDGLTISNVTASYDSGFLNDLYPGWRFPRPPYFNVSFQNISLTDTSSSTSRLPIDNAYHDTNQHLKMSNIQVSLKRWQGHGHLPLPTIAGRTNSVQLNYLITGDSSRVVLAQTSDVQITLQATPSTLKPDASTVLNWSTQNADVCTSAGAWSGTLPTGGTRKLKLGSAGAYDFVLNCRKGSTTSTATLRVVVSP